MPKPTAYCSLCGNGIRSTDKECQSGGPTPDGCELAAYGVRDKLRKIESAKKDRECRP